MGLEQSIKVTIEHNVESQLIAFESTSGNEDELNQFLHHWGGEGSPYEFQHGFILGMVQGSMFSTARTLLKRPLNKEEKDDLSVILESQKEKILDIVNRIKSA